jgi:hypothetical protein
MNEDQKQELEKEMTPYVAILAREFRKARGLPEDRPLSIAFRADESIVILEDPSTILPGVLSSNVWIMQIGSDDDDFTFYDNDGVECKFPIPEDWFKLEEEPR